MLFKIEYELPVANVTEAQKDLPLERKSGMDSN